MTDTTVSSCHDLVCVRAYPDCLCVSCQRDNADCCSDRANDVELSGGMTGGCYVVKCHDYLKEEATDHADT